MDKKIYLLLFISAIFTGFSSLNGQTIPNLRFAQEGKHINIHYDLLATGTDQTYEVNVFLSTDGGTSLRGPLKMLSGDHGPGIRPGNGKKIMWDVLAEVEKLTGEVFFELSVMPDGAVARAGAGCVDVDGNRYKTVQIGSQEWMEENLKVTHYPDGSSIPLITNNNTWSKLKDNNTDDAYCYYNNNSSSEYGALYTYAAALKACPEGWHLPSDAEWSELEKYLANNGYNYDGTTDGDRDKIAKAMATDSGWNLSSRIGAVGNSDYPSKRNSSGFSGLPGGIRSSYDGTFGTAGYYGYWWSVTENSGTNAYYRYLYYDSANVSRYHSYKSSGFNVRCVRD
jgi:uncharacterized protein (TIGR02145 family)